jgi:riboflavin transporter FmnP
MKTVKNKSRRSISSTTQRIVGISVFSALAFIVALVCSPIPAVQGFLSLDVKDAIITIAAFVYGPVSAVIISVIAAALEFLTISTTAWYGFLMNFVSSATFSLTASLIYSKRRTFGASLVGIYSAVISTTAMMLLMNLFVTPWYLVYIGLPLEVARGEVARLLPFVITPFNFSKALLNSSVIMLLYKPLSAALSKAGIGMKSAGNLKWNRRSLVILLASLAALIVAFAVLLILWLNG